MNDEKILSAEKLFQYRRLLDKSVPQKGGSKEYAPDGSWLQNKRLEAFYQERTSVLGEQRVEKFGGLVQAEWNPERGLVEFSQEIGKFWGHMGFVDQSRKWLYPEEALFLMETSVLEVYYGGVPLSIQEAYSGFLSDTVSLEEYLTYSHLRRLGYVVLRHKGRSSITPYERKIKLDQHKKDTKRHRQNLNSDECEETAKKQKVERDSGEQETSPVEFMDTGIVDSHCPENNKGSDRTDKKCSSEPALLTSGAWALPSNWDKDGKKQKHCQLDFDSVNFPDIGNKDTVALSIPNAKYLPPNIVISEEFEDVCLFDVREYRQQQRTNSTPRQHRQKADNYIYDLDFSYSDWARKRRKISAKNWTEYKEKLSESQLPHQIRPSPVSHLWEGEVTPLVRPQDATTTGEVLSRLQVIQSVDLPECEDRTASNIKISFDVHLPNARFKKTQPGLPNHRVCVVRSSDPPPTMADITQVVKRYDDNVPVNWAVVDSGDVAFYSMSSITIPVDNYMG